MLKRLRNHEDGDYLSSIDELSLGSVFPGHFYKQTKCCKNCWKIYTLVDEHRARAVKKLENQGANLDELNLPARPHTVEGTSPIKRSQRLFNALTGKESLGGSFDAGSSLEESSGMGGGSEVDFETDQVKGMKLAYAAIADLSKSDVAELRSFSKPPPAVLMVVSALMILLEGNVLGWTDAKRLMSNGERFVNSLLDFDPDEITPNQITLLRPYEANPNFHPQAVAPINGCAAKFLSWVIGMLNAYRWKRGENHKRIDVLQTGTGMADSPGREARRMPQIAFASSSVGGFESVGGGSFAEKLERRRVKREKEKISRVQQAGGLRPMTSPVKVEGRLGSVFNEIENQKRGRKARKEKMGYQAESNRVVEVGFGRSSKHTEVYDKKKSWGGLKGQNKPGNNSRTLAGEAMDRSQENFGPKDRSLMMPESSLGFQQGVNQSLTGFSSMLEEGNASPKRALTKREKQAKAQAQKMQMDR